MKFLQKIMVAVLISGTCATSVPTIAQAQTANVQKDLKTTIAKAIKSYENATSSNEITAYEKVVRNMRLVMDDQKSKMVTTGQTDAMMAKMDNLMNTYNKMVVAKNSNQKAEAVIQMKAFVNLM